MTSKLSIPAQYIPVPAGSWDPPSAPIQDSGKGKLGFLFKASWAALKITDSSRH